jgi:hypothetical protein
MHGKERKAANKTAMNGRATNWIDKHFSQEGIARQWNDDNVILTVRLSSFPRIAALLH